MLCVFGVFFFFFNICVCCLLFSLTKRYIIIIIPAATARLTASTLCYTDEASVLVVLDGDFSGRQQAVHVGLGSVLPRRQTLQAVVCTHRHAVCSMLYASRRNCHTPGCSLHIHTCSQSVRSMLYASRRNCHTPGCSLHIHARFCRCLP